jgi:RNA polymerase sigma-70 factor, ECF subfamily
MVALFPMAKESADKGKLSLPHQSSPERDDSAKPSTETTFALVLRAKAGDRSALDELCLRYLPRLRRWAHGRLPAWSRSAIDTEDLVQETLAHVAGRIDRFDPRHEGAFQAYLRQAILNRIRSEVRGASGKLEKTLGSEQPSPSPSPLEEAIGTELLERYEAALMRVTPEDREAIIARVEMGLRWSEIAEALDKNSSESAQMTVKRALVRLAREMSHERGD